MSGADPLNAFRSFTPGMTLPAFPDQRMAGHLALQYQLEQSQWWPAQRIIEQQFRQLRQLLAFAAANSPFFRERLGAHGLDQAWIRDLDPDSYRRLPPLRRGELQQHIDAIRIAELPNGHGDQNEVRTSGSTGTPVRAYGTAVTRTLWQAFTLRDHLWHQRDFSCTLAAIRSSPADTALAPEGLRQKTWGPPVDFVYDTGPAALLNSATAVEQQYDWLQRLRPEYLITHPSNLMALARYSRDATRPLDFLRDIRGVGEPVTPTLRAAVREVFGCGVSDMYSCQESGYLALQCPEHDHYHVMSEGVYLEVVDEQDRPLGPGEEGRLLVTNLNNFATPMLRYELGDRAVLGEPCPCGRGLPVIARILGRERNMLRMPDGSQRWPYFGFSAFIDVIAMQQFQVVQHSVEELEFRMVVAQQPSAQQEQRLIAILRESMGYPFAVRIRYEDQIPRSASGKFEEFISYVDEPTKPR